MVDRIIIQRGLDCPLPRFSDVGIRRHDLLRAEFDDLLEAHGDDVGVPLGLVNVRAKPGSQVLSHAAILAVEVQGRNHDVDRLGRRVFVHSPPQLSLDVVIDRVVEMNRVLTDQASQ
jgi:hypothetical protein